MWSWFLIFHKLEFLDNIHRKPRMHFWVGWVETKTSMAILQLLGRTYWYWVNEICLLYSMFVRILRITVYNWWHHDEWFSGALKFRPLLGCVGKKNTAGLIWGRSFSLRSSWHLGQALAFPWGSERHECLDETGFNTIFQRRFLILFWRSEAVFAIVPANGRHYINLHGNKQNPSVGKWGEMLTQSIIKDDKTSCAQSKWI